MTASKWLRKNGYKDGMIWTLDNVANVMEQFNNQQNVSSQLEPPVLGKIAYIQETKEYKDALDDYLDNGIDYTVGTLCNTEFGDLQQLISDSFHRGVMFVLQKDKSNFSA